MEDIRSDVIRRVMRGVGFEPTNPYGSGFPSDLTSISTLLSPPPLARLGYPRASPVSIIYASSI